MSEMSDIFAAMASVPDIDIDPNSGTVTRRSGKVLGESYAMEGKLDPIAVKKVKNMKVAREGDKQATQNTVDAYRSMMNMPNKAKVIVEEESAILEVSTLDETEDFMMDIYAQAINKKLKRKY